jgi:hypothetical protein
MSKNKQIKDIDLLTQSSKIDNVMKIVDPYTIFVINNSIDKISYKQLADEYPSLKEIILHEKKITQNNNIVYSNSRCQVTINKNIGIDKHQDIFSSLWKQFLEYHLSNIFISNLIKTLEINQNEIKDKNLDIEITVGYNLPVCYDYIPFVEDISDDILCYGWFLMRNDNDTSKGGNLELNYRSYDNSNQMVTKKITTIPYQKNCFIVINNTIKQKYDSISFSFTKRQISINTHKYLTFKLKKIKENSQ